MGKKDKKKILDEKNFAREAKRVSHSLLNKLEDNFFLDIGSRAIWLARGIGEVEGYLAAKSGKGTLLERAIFLVNVFDQADTGGAIMNKPGGMELLAVVDRLRKALNQNGKLTMLDSQQIKEILEVRAAPEKPINRERRSGQSEFLEIRERVAERNKDKSPTTL